MLQADDLIEVVEIIPGNTPKETLDAISSMFDGHAFFMYIDKEIVCRVSIRPIYFPDWFLRQCDTGNLETNVFLWGIQASYCIHRIYKAFNGGKIC